MVPVVQADSVRNMFASIASRYDLVNSVLSMGMHHLWKYKFIKQVPQVNRALDLCTGTGDLLPLLAKRAKDVTGADFCQPMLDVAAKRFGNRFKLIREDALAMSFAAESFDVVTVAFGVRNFENTERGLKEINRVLSHQGSIFILEFGQAQGIIAPIYNFYSKYILPLIGGVLSGNMQAYKYLPETAKAFPCGNKFVELLNNSGFVNVSAEPLMGGIAYIYRGRKA